MSMVANPVYKPTPGYCMNGFYPGYTVGRGSTGAMHSVIQALESFRNTNIEAISVGLPNELTDVTSTINDLQGCPQHVIGTLPLGTLSGSYSLSMVARGDTDTLYLDMFTKLVAAGWNGDRITIRLGWEWDGTWTWGLALWNPTAAYIDPVTGKANTPATYRAAFRRVVGLAREAGFTGRFDWNGTAPNSSIMTTYQAVYPGNDFGTNRTTGGGCQIVGNDFYNAISNAAVYNTSTTPYTYQYGYKKSDYLAIWNGEALARFNAVAQFARQNGLLFGIAECGQIIHHTNKYVANDSAVYWQKLHDAIVANADVVCYVCPFNQVMLDSSGNVLEDDAMFVWNGTTGVVPSATWTGDTIVATGASPAGVAAGTQPPSMGSYQNGNSNPTGFWAVSPSPNQKIGTPVYQSLFTAGSMVYQSTAPVSSFTYHHRIENFPTAAAEFDVKFGGAADPTTSLWTSPPTAPQSVSVKRAAGGTTAAVTWTAPTFDGGSPITSYVVTVNGTAANVQQPTSTSATVTVPLAPDAAIGVYAVNAAGRSPSTSVTLPAVGVPTAPTGVAAAVASSTSVVVSWPKVTGADTYQVTVSAGSLLETGDFFADTFSDHFTATVVPTGTGTASLQDVFSDTYASTFGTPVSGGGAPIAATAQLTTTDVQVTVTGLTPATAYVVTVSAKNAVGASPVSSPAAFTTLATDSSSGSGTGSIGTPPVVLPQPVSWAFPPGASFRPVNFGAAVANNG